MTKPMAERVEFDIVAHRGLKTEHRVYTDGEYVWWASRTGDHIGSVNCMPRSLFLLAAMVVANRCEAEAHGDDWDIDSRLFDAASRNMLQPVEQAMVWPIEATPDDDDENASDAGKFGYSAVVAEITLDEPPKHIKPW